MTVEVKTKISELMSPTLWPLTPAPVQDISMSVNGESQDISVSLKKQFLSTKKRNLGIDGITSVGRFNTYVFKLGAFRHFQR